ncbi:YbaB/EbfC family nucleoid-associated protein [Arachnia rubra]|jgi:DNA-binding protein, ybaB/ebfC family|uniref:Nucleoid-associated protein J5A65_03700 n=1 Tax=Arachnia rubra TaxID=1547448 RepID=A0ABX7Y7Y8_9ACTN|nr:YbaB/EbfC family nucleoid-associated protein [Arachnia rubra]MBB1576985.1 YbaB/EbfC family nucleoid-associated protein [Propionibacterium sp.]MDO4645587.1 YbaB/EbfC family nucleoid-associated protein [Propionibacteriaceae bacterium]QUC08848.1 YbaB/EbfC family nucleoid-associated protein [Arachnia rubra]BCR80282.1 nucleoid-associated protein YaaK [Arachnia rubra]
MIEGLDMNALLAQAQQMQEQMIAARDGLAGKEFEGTAGGDLVTVKLNGLGEMLDVTIAPAACDPEDTESLSAMIVAAFRTARQQVEAAAEAVAPQMPGMGF